MKIAGIVAEYNPFHNGHAYLADELRARGATHVVAVMSGHLVQRGETALFSKWARTSAALRCGVDLVLELPSLYAAGSAERFADAAVALLDAAGCVDLLGFGSECGTLEPLLCAAEACMNEAVDAQVRRELESGASYAAARQAAVEWIFDKNTAAVLEQPNNILGVEYLKALKRQSSRMVPLTVPRKGSGHDADVFHNTFASASALRGMFAGGDWELARPFVPKQAWEVYRAELEQGTAPCRLDQLERGILFRLRTMCPEEFDRLPDVSEGLAERLCRAAKGAGTLEEFYAAAKTKRYAHARLRRIALYAALGVTKEDIHLPPPYLRILGMNRKGLEVAARMKQEARLPYGTSLAKLAEAGGRVADFEVKAGELYALGCPVPLPSGLDFTREAVLIED